MTAQGQIDETLPASIEAEQQVLGAILSAADAAEAGARVATVQEAGGASIFFDPMHAAIFKEVAKRASDGLACDAVALRLWARDQQGMADLGGPKYLVDVTLSALVTSALPSYCQHLADLAARRSLIGAVSDARLALSADEEPVEQVAGRLEAALAGVNAPSRRKPVSIMAATHKAFADLLSAQQGGDTGYLHTGIPSLDHWFSGFWPGELVLLGGRPSMGKTGVALSLALNAARAGHGVAVFSLEMNPDQMAIRAISEQCSHIGRAVAYESIRRGEVHQRDMDTVRNAAAIVGELPIQFLSREYADLGGLYAGATRAQKALGGNMRLLIVDYVQLIRSTAKGRYEQITEISIALKALAGRLNVPVLALSQLSRQVESRDDKRPMLSDLRESGQLEQDADAVMFCYRDEYYLEREKPAEDAPIEEHEEWRRAMEHRANRLEIIVAKQRQGRVGTAHMRFNPATNFIWDDRRGA